MHNRNTLIITTFIFSLCFTLVSYADNYHPADTNKDWKINQQEFQAYNDAWKNHLSWPAGPDPIPMEYVSRAGFILKKSEGYRFVSVSEPFCWISYQKPTQTQITNTIGMVFNLIEPGLFTMGSPSTESGRGSNENQYPVRITRGYYMQTTEVTQGQWKAVMGS
ncbi:MAG: SUMF1/EgtB/PvdO family nonheme iron enzyme, partial [Candidatus Magnetomorum sp.]|nr:SUMF1/EgtB/PvdO family nonheme iron enzyme [Candidatus Magnetomorum sp.]